MKNILKALVKDERGVSIVEALLYAAVIAGIVYVATNNIGNELKSGATTLGNQVETKLTPSWK
jgi:Flp pilus assembly pilin Flp